MPLQTAISFAPNHAPCLLNAFLFSTSPASTPIPISVTLCHNGPEIFISTTHPTQSPGFLSHSCCSSCYYKMGFWSTPYNYQQQAVSLRQQSSAGWTFRTALLYRANATGSKLYVWPAAFVYCLMWSRSKIIQTPTKSTICLSQLYYTKTLKFKSLAHFDPCRIVNREYTQQTTMCKILRKISHNSCSLICCTLCCRSESREQTVPCGTCKCNSDVQDLGSTLCTRRQTAR